MPDRFLDDLQQTLNREIPMCRAMDIRVGGIDAFGLSLSMPLELNRNHNQTAFAGSLNALCTIAGWGQVYCLLRHHGHTANIVIRRSNIRYLRPVADERIHALCTPVADSERDYFLEMLIEKGKAKLDLDVRVEIADGPAVMFLGSYVAELTG